MKAPRGLRLALLAVVAVSTLIPFAFLIALSLGVDWFWPRVLPTNYDLAAWRPLLADGAQTRIGRAAWNSILLATGTGALAAALGLPIGRALGRLHGGLRTLGAAAAFLPVAAPPIALAVGLQFTFVAAGLAGSRTGVLLAHLVPAAGYAALFFLGIFHGYDAREEEAARTLGASPRDVLLRVTIPALRRPIAEAFVLGFLISWAQVPLTLLIGQGLVPTLAVDLLGYVQAGQDRMAATGALLLVLPPILLMMVVGFAVRRTQAVAV